jgi:hypothetical protein
MKLCLTTLLAFAHFIVSAQNPNWFANQSNNGIRKREVFHLYSNNQERKLEIMEEFNKNGNLTFSSSITRSESTIQKKNVYAGDSCVSYSCMCKDINTFVSKFHIVDSKTYQRQNGMGSGNGPTEKVTISKFDKRGNTIIEKTYAPSGLNILTTTCTYDKKNNRLSAITINLDDEETQNERFIYNSRGQKTEQFSKNTHLKPGRHSVFSYDKKNRINDLKIFEEEKLTTHLHYDFIQKGDTILYIQNNVLDNNSRIKSGDIVNAKGQILKSLIFYDGQVQNSTEYKYDNQGRKISILQYNIDNELTSELNYTFDNKDNWKTLETKELVHVSEGNAPPRKEYQKNLYVQEIQYK